MIPLDAGTYEALLERKSVGPRTRAKIAAAHLSDALGVTQAAERLTAGSLVILTYHRVLPRAQKWITTSQPMILAVEAFEAQMRELARRYRALSLEEVQEHFRAGSAFPSRAVHVTFDDGYADNFEHAAPVLERYSIPATFFLTTGPMDGGGPLWWDALGAALLALRGRRPAGAAEALSECPAPLQQQLAGILEDPGAPIPSIDRCVSQLNRLPDAARNAIVEAIVRLAAPYREGPQPRLMLTWDEVRAMHRAGMEMGGHTVLHRYLDELDDARGPYEILHGLERIAEETGTWPRVFSYPAGRTCEKSRGWFEQAGIELAMTTRIGRNRIGDDRYGLRRWDGAYLAVGDRFIDACMHLELSGAMDWAAWAYRDARGPARTCATCGRKGDEVCDGAAPPGADGSPPRTGGPESSLGPNRP